MNTSQQAIILFDGECGLCNTLVNFVLKRDNHQKFEYIALQSNRGQALLNIYGLSTSSLSSVVYIKNGRYYLKSKASLLILKDLESWWKVFYVFMIIPGSVRDFIYDILAKNRHHFFGKQKSCKL